MNISNEAIIITGGAGFIGTSLINKLIDNNRVTIIDNFTRDSISKSNLLHHKNLKLFKRDILNLEDLDDVFEKATIVIHLAAIAGIDTVHVNPVSTMKVNLIGTANLLDKSLRCKNLKKFINVSTSEIFGKFAFKSKESDSAVSGSLGESRWTYAVSKLASEHLALAYHKQFGIPVVNLRPFNVYGPGQTGEGALSKFIKLSLQNKTIFIDGDGAQIRSWCYIDDFVNAFLQSIVSNKSVGESFNIGNPRATITILGLANTVCRVLKSNSKILHKMPLSQDIEIRIPSTEKAEEILNFKPKVDLEEGIKKTAGWFSNNE